MIADIKQVYNKIPSSIQVFIKRALLLFILWQSCYHFLLEKNRLVDGPLTNFTAFLTAKSLSLLYAPSSMEVNAHSATVLINNKKILGIADGCNALELYVIYLGFIICMPANIKRLVFFAVFGVISILILNIFRCYTIALLHIHHPSLVDFAHHYLFYFIVYGYIFYIWTLYCKKLFAQAPHEERHDK